MTLSASFDAIYGKFMQGVFDFACAQKAEVMAILEILIGTEFA
jgi:hypothetical protein